MQMIFDSLAIHYFAHRAGIDKSALTLEQCHVHNGVE